MVTAERKIMNQRENPTITDVANANFQNLQKIRMDSNEVNFSLSLRPIYQFSRIFGLMPFTIVLDAKNNFQKVHVRPFDVFRFVTAIFLCTVMAFIYYQHIEVPQGQNISSILVFGDATLFILGLIYVCFVIVMDMMNRFKLIAILKMLNNFDNEVCIFE